MKKEDKMRKKLSRLKIGVRLKKSFRQIIYIFGALAFVIVLVVMYVSNDYSKILDNYAYPQGDIALAMNETAEVRAATRGIVGYDSEELVESMKKQHEQAVADFEKYLEQIRPTMITDEGKAAMEAIDKAWEEYQEVEAKAIELGQSLDVEKSVQAQTMMSDEVAPKYQALDEAMEHLMDINVTCGDGERSKLATVIVISIIVIAVVIISATVYATRLAVTITAGIEKPLSALKDRFATFAEGDLDSPMPAVETQDEIADLIEGVSAMADRLNLIINDAGRLLNEMAGGNFAIATECEDQYMGAFQALILGMRKMNRQIDTTVRGVSEASEQVLVGSSNLAQAA